MITHSNPHALSHKRRVFDFLHWIKIVILPKSTKQFPEYMWQTNSFEDPLSLRLIESTIISTISWYHKKSARGHKKNRWELRKERKSKNRKKLKSEDEEEILTMPQAFIIIIIRVVIVSLQLSSSSSQRRMDPSHYLPSSTNDQNEPFPISIDVPRLHLVRHFFLKSFSMHHRP